MSNLAKRPFAEAAVVQRGGRMPLAPTGSSTAARAKLQIDLGRVEEVGVVRPAEAKHASRWSAGRIVLFALVLAYLGSVLLLPIGALAVKAVAAGPLRMADALAGREALEDLGRTLVLALSAVVLNGAFGIAAAIVLVRQRFRGQWIPDALVDLSLAVSPVMTGLAFLLVFGRAGWLSPLIERLDMPVVFAFPGLLLCTLFVTLPFTMREVSYVLEERGTGDEEAAATLGASAWQTFWRVTLPNIRHGLSLGVTLTAARALGEFGAVLVVGGAISGKTPTATTFIYAASEERHDAAAFGMSLVLALASMLLLAVLERLKRRREDL